MRAFEGIRSDLLRLKYHVAAMRFQLALRKHAIALKAGFDPEQPRDDDGKWIEAGGGEADEEEIDESSEFSAFEDFDLTDFSDTRRRPPPIESPADIPNVRPETVQDINRIAREVSRNPYLAPYYFVTIAESAGHWLNEKRAEIVADQDPPKSLEELHSAVFRSDKRGYDDHHIVERWTAREGLFPSERVNGNENVVSIPRYKHEEINSWFQTGNDDFDGMSPRKYLQGKSWEEHRSLGLKALRDVGVLKP